LQAVYQSLLHLTWVDRLLENIRTIFVSVYKDQLASSNAAVAIYDFDGYYDQQLRELDISAGAPLLVESPRIFADKKEELQDGDTGGPPPPPIPGGLRAQPMAAPTNGDFAESAPVESAESSRPTTPIPGRLLAGRTGPGGRGSRRSRKSAHVSSNASSGDETRKGRQPRSPAKKMRKWDSDGLADEDDGTNLDYSTNEVDKSVGESMKSHPLEAAARESWGIKTSKGQFILRDLDDEVSSILQNAAVHKDEPTHSGNLIGSSFGAVSGYFRNIVGGKTLKKQDLEEPLKAIEHHLIQKNVAREAAIRLCEGVEHEMVGKKTASFESTEKALRPAMESSLRRILTPTSSLDLLQEIQSVAAPTIKTSSARPYVISIVGVNGVGKSTNLAKICYFLLQNNYRVLVAACDTFRSGAVEQLNHHVRNLKELSAREKVGEVDLYQKGYGKDAANVAKDAVAYAVSHDFDVVLIDTAGRRHNDTRLMSSLEKFANFARPDKILMVGEALVGTDSVMQARNFNAAFGPGRNVDGFIVSKCDTVGDMIGTVVSMVHATGIPVVFLGVGQHYGDLRNLSVQWAVNLLMS
jgi:signal recognition particle receptor subunit alpha